MNAMDNPLLDFAGLPRFDAVRPAHIVPAIDALLGEARAAVERVAADPQPATWDRWSSRSPMHSTGSTARGAPCAICTPW